MDLRNSVIVGRPVMFCLLQISCTCLFVLSFLLCIIYKVMLDSQLNSERHLTSTPERLHSLTLFMPKTWLRLS